MGRLVVSSDIGCVIWTCPRGNNGFSLCYEAKAGMLGCPFRLLNVLITRAQGKYDFHYVAERLVTDR